MEKAVTQMGWVSVSRSIRDKGYYVKSTYVHLWLHLLLSVNSSPKEFLWNGKIIIIGKGQFVTGRNKLSKETGIKKSTIEDILNLFEKEQQIRQQKTTKHRIITILNWEKYQTKRQQADNKPTTSRQQADTNNNNNNNNNRESAVALTPSPKEKAMFFFKGVRDFITKKSSDEAVAMSNSLSKMFSEQSIDGLKQKKAIWDEIVAFSSYWEEKDHMGKKERWEMQKTFEVERRLQTWLKRAGQWSKPANQNKGRGFA